jgi:hypothetical protein
VKERHEQKLMLFADATSACYDIGDEELTVSPWSAKVIVTGKNRTKYSVGWFPRPSKEGCWPWRLALVGEDSFLLFSYPTRFFLGDWFSILKICNAF